MKIFSTIGTFLQLIKVTVTLPVVFLAFTGYCLADQTFGSNVWWVCTGVFLLAGAASALNQILEKNIDSRMRRTQKRPLPSGKIAPGTAWFIVILLATSGIFILAQFNVASVVLGFITLFWYIVIYTFLKRITAFAVIPGSLTGALPPVIGWVAAGGNITDPLIICIAAFVFIWQIPHFWLLILMYGKEYQEAGLPTLFDIFTEEQIRAGTFILIIFSAAYSVIFTMLFHNHRLLPVIISLSILMSGAAYYFLLKLHTNKSVKLLFHSINSFMLLFLALILLIRAIGL